MNVFENTISLIKARSIRLAIHIEHMEGMRNV
jgi:hypothetical protein